MIGVIIQARSGSKRFPNKIYADINGKICLQRVLDGVCDAAIPNKIILAMPDYDKKSLNNARSSAKLIIWDNRFFDFFGNPDDLVERYFGAANKFGLSVIVRVTADCPFIQGKMIDDMLLEYMKDPNTYMANNDTICSMPYVDGLDIQIFNYRMIAETYLKTRDKFYREHVCPYMYREDTDFKIQRYSNIPPHQLISTKLPKIALDTLQDYELVKKLAIEYDKDHDINRAIEVVSNEI